MLHSLELELELNLQSPSIFQSLVTSLYKDLPLLALGILVTIAGTTISSYSFTAAYYQDSIALRLNVLVLFHI